MFAAIRNHYRGFQHLFASPRMMADKMAQDSKGLAGEWALLGLIDPALGPVSREDRLHARLAAARIRGWLASINVTARNAVQIADRLQVDADPQRLRILTLPAACARAAA